MILRRGWSPSGFSLVAVFLDQLLLLVSYNLAFALLLPRKVPHILPETWYLAVVPMFFEPLYLRFFLVLVGVLTLLLVSFGTYRNAYVTSFPYQAQQTLRALILGNLLVLVAVLALGVPVDLDFYVSVIGFQVLLLPLCKLLIGDVKLVLKRLGAGKVRTAIAGNSAEIDALLQRIEHELAENYTVVALLPDSKRAADTAGDTPVIPSDRIAAEFTALAPHLVLAPEPMEDQEHLERLRWVCREREIALKVIPCEQTVAVGETRVHDLLGVPLEMPFRLRQGGLQFSLKRGIDFVGASLALVLLSPFLLGVAIWIKLDSPGPLFYTQTRLTRGRKPFKIIKFRSMYIDADERLAELRAKSEVTGPIFKMREDPRITRAGKFIRKTSIDEIPQFLNVLMGHLSLVGPRPPIPAEVEKYEEWQLGRLDVLCGITGLWQVSGRSTIDFEEMVLLDLYYIENWSLLLDIEILLDTVPTVLFGRGAF